MSVFTRMAELEAQRRAFVLAVVTHTGGSTPRLAGTQMAIDAQHIAGTIGGGAFEHLVVQRARTLLADPELRTDTVVVHLVEDLGMCCGGRMTAFLSKHQPDPRLWIFGAGHVGTAVAQVAGLSGFACTVVDERDAWADATRFAADVEVLDTPPDDLLRDPQRGPGPHDWVLITTHDHDLDERLIRLLAPRDLAWLGLIGSRGKWARFVRRLRAREVPEPALDRVRCPVGLKIGSEGPGEIAVSIVAEIIALRRGVTP
jgi:xanthine dehydrogenase accessory factor